MKRFTSLADDIKYIGDITCESTSTPDWTYNDGGVIYYADGKNTGYIQDSPVRTYFDLDAIKCVGLRDG